MSGLTGACLLLTFTPSRNMEAGQGCDDVFRSCRRQFSVIHVSHRLEHSLKLGQNQHIYSEKASFSLVNTLGHCGSIRSNSEPNQVSLMHVRQFDAALCARDL